jgi:hypothetical protein
MKPFQKTDFSRPPNGATHRAADFAQRRGASPFALDACQLLSDVTPERLVLFTQSAPAVWHREERLGAQVGAVP